MQKIVFLHGAAEISDTKNENDFKVNGQRLKPFLKSVPVNKMAVSFRPNVSVIFLFSILFHASIHFFHTLGAMHEISVGEGSNMTNIKKN